MPAPKATMFPTHLVLLGGIANILHFDLTSGKPLEGSRGLDGHDKLRSVVELTKLIPTTDLRSEPEKVTEVQLAGTRLIDGLKTQGFSPAHLLSQFTEHLVNAGNALAHNNHTKQNGNGDYTGPGDKTVRRTHAQQ